MIGALRLREHCRFVTTPEQLRELVDAMATKGYRPRRRALVIIDVSMFLACKRPQHPRVRILESVVQLADKHNMDVVIAGGRDAFGFLPQRVHAMMDSHVKMLQAPIFWQSYT
jgi:hypothetical protein